jgi:hypothetical protein
MDRTDPELKNTKKGEVTSVKEKKRPRPPAALKAAWVLSWIRCMHGGQFCNIQTPVKGTVAWHIFLLY